MENKDAARLATVRYYGSPLCFHMYECTTQLRSTPPCPPATQCPHPPPRYPAPHASACADPRIRALHGDNPQPAPSPLPVAPCRPQVMQFKVRKADDAAAQAAAQSPWQAELSAKKVRSVEGSHGVVAALWGPGGVTLGIEGLSRVWAFHTHTPTCVPCPFLSLSPCPDGAVRPRPCPPPGQERAGRHGRQGPGDALHALARGVRRGAGRCVTYGSAVYCTRTAQQACSLDRSAHRHATCRHTALHLDARAGRRGSCSRLHAAAQCQVSPAITTAANKRILVTMLIPSSRKRRAAPITAYRVRPALTPLTTPPPIQVC